MGRILEILGYHSALKDQDVEYLIATVLLPFVTLAIIVATGLKVAFG